MSKRMGEAFWARHVEAAHQSGLSAIAYAKQQGIPVKRLYFWQRRFKEVGAADLRSHAGAFVAVRVAAPAVSLCTLILASGLRLEMSALPAPEWLAAVGRAAQGER